MLIFKILVLFGFSINAQHIDSSNQKIIEITHKEMKMVNFEGTTKYGSPWNSKYYVYDKYFSDELIESYSTGNYRKSIGAQKDYFRSDTIIISDCNCPDGKSLSPYPTQNSQFFDLENYHGFWCGHKFWSGHQYIVDDDGLPIKFFTYSQGEVIDSLSRLPILKYSCIFNIHKKTKYNKKNGKYKIYVTWTGGSGDTLEFRLSQKSYLIAYWTEIDLKEKSESKEMEFEPGMYHFKIINNDKIIFESDVSINPNHY